MLSMALCAAVVTLGTATTAGARDRDDRHEHARSDDRDHAKQRDDHRDRGVHGQDDRLHDRYARSHRSKHERFARYDRRHRLWHRSHARHDHGPRYARGVKVSKHAPFYCKRCSHAFHQRNDFYSHVHLRHRVPLWQIPFRLVHASIGWVFYG
jgi:hypothetical protein